MNTTTRASRAIIIGTGHNALVCACYLARAGVSVSMFERRNRIGGLCVTEELQPGVPISTVAGWYGMLREEIVADLELERYGLTTFITDPLSVVLFPQGKFSVTRADLSGYNNLGPIDNGDLDGWGRWNSEVSKGAQLLRPLLLRPPIPQKQVELLFESQGLPRLSQALFREPIIDVVSEYLKMSELVALSASVSPAIPTSRGSVYARIYSGTAVTNGRQGVWGMCKGGMGAITDCLAGAARDLGVSIHLGEGIKQISENNQVVDGVVTDSGTFIEASLVVSGADPLSTMQLLSQQGIIKELTNSLEIQNTEAEFTGLKAHVLLRKLPKLRAAIDDKHAYNGLVIMVPRVEELRALAATAALQRLPSGNILSLRFTSVTDNLSLGGKHIGNISCRAIPFQLDGKSWTTETREKVFQYVLSQLDRYYVDFAEHVENWMLVTPDDYKTKFGIQSMNGWHIPWSKMFDQRPIAQLSGYHSPVHGLYLCGAGMHPGPNVTGAPGFNCAQVILSKLRQ